MGYISHPEPELASEISVIELVETMTSFVSSPFDRLRERL